MESEKWKVENGKWDHRGHREGFVNEKWKMKNGKWKMENGTTEDTERDL